MLPLNGSRANAVELRAALAAWRQSVTACRRHFSSSAAAWAGPDGTNDRVMGAADAACNRLVGLVLDACDCDTDVEPVAVDLGDTLLVVGYG
jgi:hypothetical protein